MYVYDMTLYIYIYISIYVYICIYIYILYIYIYIYNILQHHILIILRDQGLRLKRICSEKEDFLKHMSEMKSWLLKRGYPEKIVDQKLRKVNFSKSSPRANKRDKGVCSVTTYHPLLQKVGRIFHRHLDLLYAYLKELFGPMALFRSARKSSSSYLVGAKLYSEERRVGSFKCGGKRCQVFLNVTGPKGFTSTTTNQSYKINHELNCNESSLIYLLIRKICLKQYAGQTVDIFRSR